MIPQRLLIALTLLALVPFTPAAVAHDHGSDGAFAASPTRFAFGDVLRDEPVTRVVQFQNTKDKDAEVVLQPDGDLASWVTTPEGDRFVLRAGETRTMPLVLTVPEDAGNGNYSDVLRAVMQPTEDVPEGRSGYRVALSLALHLSATVSGREYVNVVAGKLAVRDTEPGLPVSFDVWVRNLGNVRAAPRVDVRVQDVTGAVHHEEALVTPVVAPGEEHAFTFDAHPPRLEPGQYWLNATVRVRDDVILERALTFDVLAPGELTRKGTTGLVHTSTADDPTPRHRLPAGQVFRMHIPFENTGELDVTASFKGSIIRDGTVVRDVVTEERRVPPGGNVTFTVTLTDVTAPGTYNLVGRVHYAGKVTEETHFVFNLVPSDASVTGRVVSAAPAAVGALLAGALALAFSRRERT